MKKQKIEIRPKIKKLIFFGYGHIDPLHFENRKISEI